MTCTPFSIGGMTGFVCSRGPKATGPRHYCVACLRDGKKTPAPWLCDYPQGTALPAVGRTCDKAMCDEHRTNIRPNCDHCPDHGGNERNERG